MNTYRMNAMMAGIFYFLGTVVAFSSAVIGGEVLSSINTGKLLVGVDILNLVAANSSGVTGGAFFILLTMMSLVAMTVFLYPVFRKDSPELAMGMVLFRGALEGTGYLLSAVVALALVALSNEYAAGGSQSAALLSMGTVLYQIGDRLAPITSIVFLIGTSCLYLSFFRTRLIPRWLSVWGLIGVVPYMAYALLHFFHMDTGYELYMQMVLMPQELVMAVWLIAKGFAPSAIAALPPTTRLAQVKA
ncbi:MAG TPA: DUF4386 domain-containing protein [Anaerolineales bacterium]|nr:DUF4386 domain-containing protein [Anaerolineales bacterium]